MTDARHLAAEWRELQARHAAVACELERELHERHGIGVSEFDALEWLADADREKVRGQELTEALPLSQSAASRLVARLERRGLVARAMCEMDRRGIFVMLTEEGRQRYREAQPTQRAVLERHLAPDTRTTVV